MSTLTNKIEKYAKGRMSTWDATQQEELNSLATLVKSGQARITHIEEYLDKNPAERCKIFGAHKVYSIIKEIRKRLKEDTK